MGSLRVLDRELEVSLLNKTIKTAQEHASQKDWKKFEGIFRCDKKLLLQPFDLFRNTALHAVARDGTPETLEALLEMLPESHRWGALRKGNCEDNTLLHEVIFNKDVKMADVIFRFEKRLGPPPEKWPLLELTNKDGETPLFRAARHGKLEMLKHMVKVQCLSSNDLKGHFQSTESFILHTCIIGQQFEVAIWLLRNMDRKLAISSEKNTNDGLTCFQLLSKMPKAFRSQSDSLGIWKGIIYNLLPHGVYFETGNDDSCVSCGQIADIECGQQEDGNQQKPPKTSVFSRIYINIWSCLRKVWPFKDVWKLKRRHKLAEHLAEKLADIDTSWTKSYNEQKQPLTVMPAVPSNVTEKMKQIERRKQAHLSAVPEVTVYNYTPLLLAAASGIKEVVEKILERYPEAISHVSEDGHNVLHMAVKHRQNDIVDILEKKPAFDSLVPRITKDNRTLLHQAATMDFYRERQDLSGVPFQLADELHWYKRVEKMVPRHYYLHCDKEKLTPGDVLDIEHAKMHKEAKSWMKEAAQACSTVAVLVATVIFAAAYALPGGTSAESKGPVFRGTAAFNMFTIMDVFALLCSLSSVVWFLSVLTSPYELWDFHKTLPRKLLLGYASLFLSLIFTMLAFVATIMITIRLESNQKIARLAYSVSFVIISVFGLTQFPLFHTLKFILKTARSEIFSSKSKYCDN